MQVGLESLGDPRPAPDVQLNNPDWPRPCTHSATQGQELPQATPAATTSFPESTVATLGLEV